MFVGLHRFASKCDAETINRESNVSTTGNQYILMLYTYGHMLLRRVPIFQSRCMLWRHSSVDQKIVPPRHTWHWRQFLGWSKMYWTGKMSMVDRSPLRREKRYTTNNQLAYVYLIYAFQLFIVRNLVFITAKWNSGFEGWQEEGD